MVLLLTVVIGKVFKKSRCLLPLKEARRFIAELAKHEDFFEAITNFNNKKKVNWLDKKQIGILEGYVYGFYYTLRPTLKVITKNMKVLKPKIICGKM